MLVGITGVTTAALGHAAPAGAALGDLVLVSAPLSLEDPTSNGDSTDPSVSADGRLVAFASAGDSLSQADNDSVRNIYVKDIATGVVTLVSRQSGIGDTSKGANNGSDHPQISADGQFVAFESAADNLAAGADGPARDVFVRDLVTQTTVLASRATTADGAGGDAESKEASISGDGRLVTFRSLATNFSNEDDDAKNEVYLRDLVENTTTLVSRPTGTDPLPTGGSYTEGDISRDGRFVAFYSTTDALSPEDNDSVGNVYLRELATNVTTLISRQSGTGSGSLGADAVSAQPSVSADGRFVAFASDADNLDLPYDKLARNIFIRDVVANTTTLVSRQAGSGPSSFGANGRNFFPQISDDGHHVAFESNATNLDPSIITADNIFSRDLVTGAVRLVSRPAGTTGSGADSPSYAPAISGDGRFVAFDSRSLNLSTRDRDWTQDVFLRDVLGDPPPPPPVDAPVNAVGVTSPTGKPPKVKAQLASVLTTPSTRRCVSRRRITLRLKGGTAVVKLTIRVTGVKKPKTVLGTNLLVPIKLTGLPRGRYAVTVTAMLTDGSTQKLTRRYRTCTAKKRR